MKQKKQGLIGKLARNCADAVKEYPVALVYLTFLAIVMGMPDISYQSQMDYGVPLILACLGSLAASILTARKAAWMQACGQILALLMAIFYLFVFRRSNYWTYEPLRPDNHLEIANSLAAYILLLLTAVFVPVGGKGERSIDRSWSVTMRGITGGLRGALVALCVLIAMLIITAASEALLRVEIFGRFWLTFVPMMLFGSLSIAAFAKPDSITERPMFSLASFSRGVFTFVSVPLLALYLLIFYIYLGKIATTGLIPVRNVSYQAIGVFLAFCAQRYVFHQALREGGNIVAQWFNRLSPWLLFIPVAMMSWVIGHRLMTYGITVSRLYIVLINLWMYAILIWWIMTGARKVRVIPISFCAVMFLSSVTVVNVTTVTETSMRSSLREAMLDAGWKLPVTETFFSKSSIESLSAADRSLMSYLRSEMGTESLKGLIQFEDIPEPLRGSADNNIARQKNFNISYRTYASFDSLPRGCVAVNIYDYYDTDVALSNDTILFPIKDCGALMFSRKELLKIDDVHRGMNKIHVIGTVGKIHGASVSYLQIHAEIHGKAYGTIAATLFLSDEDARQFTDEEN